MRGVEKLLSIFHRIGKMIDRELLRQKIDFLYYRGRNIIYYRSIDNRPRAQYMHVLRDLREDAKNLLNEYSSDSLILDLGLIEMKIFLKGLISIIPAKVKTEECKDVIDKLEQSLYVSK